MNNKKKQYHFSNSAPLLVIWSDNYNKSTEKKQEMLNLRIFLIKSPKLFELTLLE